MRSATVTRTTRETAITATVALDGGDISISTGHAFFDHLLDALARHGRLGVHIAADGDLHIDPHHTVEDTGTVLGQALRDALGERRGIERTSCEVVPMDDALVRVVLDIGGRGYVVWSGEPSGVYTPRIDLSVLEGFTVALAARLGCNIHIDVLRGRDYHHVVEAVFKALGRALRGATRLDGTTQVPSTKGVVE
jgi:imidazoleglycerol-phosphate dehydratase